MRSKKFSLKGLDSGTADLIDEKYPAVLDAEKLFEISYGNFLRAVGPAENADEVCSVEIAKNERRFNFFSPAKTAVVFCAAILLVMFRSFSDLPDSDITPPDNMVDIPIITRITDVCTTSAASTEKIKTTSANVQSTSSAVSSQTSSVYAAVTAPAASEPAEEETQTADSSDIVETAPQTAVETQTTDALVQTTTVVTTVTRSVYEIKIELYNTTYTPAPELIEPYAGLISNRCFETPTQIVNIWRIEDRKLLLETSGEEDNEPEFYECRLLKGGYRGSSQGLKAFFAAAETDGIVSAVYGNSSDSYLDTDTFLEYWKYCKETYDVDLLALSERVSDT